MLAKLAAAVAALLIAAAPAVADTPCDRTDDLAWLFEASAPAAAQVAANDVPAAAVAGTGSGTLALASAGGRPGGNLTCTATEDCNELPDIGCSGSTCSATSRNCDIGNRGHVTCDNNTTLCSQPCPDPGGGCTLPECRMQCAEPGCFSFCVDPETCTCDVICP